MPDACGSPGSGRRRSTIGCSQRRPPRRARRGSARPRRRPRAEKGKRHVQVLPRDEPRTPGSPSARPATRTSCVDDVARGGGVRRRAAGAHRRRRYRARSRGSCARLRARSLSRTRCSAAAAARARIASRSPGSLQLARLLALGRGHVQEDEPDRLLRRAAVRPGDAGHGHAHVRPERARARPPPSPPRSRPRRRRARRARCAARRALRALTSFA